MKLVLIHNKLFLILQISNPEVEKIQSTPLPSTSSAILKNKNIKRKLFKPTKNENKMASIMFNLLTYILLGYLSMM